MSTSEGPVSRLIERIEDFTLKTRAIDEAPFGITVADMRRDDDPLVYANEGFERLTGYSESEIIDRNCRFLQGPDTRAEPVAAMREAIGNDDPVQVELRNYRKDGTMFWSEVTLAPLANDAGDVTHYVGFQQDVSRRKAYEEELEKQRSDLELLNEMMRHDIRNDLQVALASLELLELQGAGGSERITAAVESVRRAVELTNVARDVADVVSDSGDDHRPLELASVLRTEIEECRSAYPEAEVTVAGTLPAARVVGNDLLGSVFRNLLKNAVQHSDTGSPEIRLAAEADDDRVRVTVADDGPGIPEAASEHLFERDWSGGGGTGLGLYLVSRLVDNYGGEITLLDESPFDDLFGAAFRVELPLAE